MDADVINVNDVTYKWLDPERRLATSELISPQDQYFKVLFLPLQSDSEKGLRNCDERLFNQSSESDDCPISTLGEMSGICHNRESRATFNR